MAQDTITTEQLLNLKEPGTVSTEELLGPNFKPAKVDPSLPEYLKYKVNIDRASSERSKYGAEAMFGLMDNDKALAEGNKARDFWTKEAGPYNNIPFTKDPLKNVAGNVASLLPYMISSQKEGLTEGMILGGGFATIAALAGQVPPLTLMPDEFFTMPTAFAAGMSIGYADGVIRHTLKREGGGMYLDMIEAGISPETAKPLAIAGGATIGIIELASFRTLGKPFKQAFSKVIRDKLGKKSVLNAVGRYARTVGIEIAQEELQEVTSLVSETIAGMIDDKPDAIPTKKEWIQRLVETAKAMAAAMPVIAAPGAIVDVTSTIKNERLLQRKADLVKLEELNQESIDQDKSQIDVEAPAVEAPTPSKEVAKPPVEKVTPKVTEEIKPKEVETPKIEQIGKAIQEGKLENFIDANLQKEIERVEAKEKKRLSIKEKADIEVKNIESVIEAIKESPEYSSFGEQIFPDKAAVLKELRDQLSFQKEKIKGLKPETISIKETALLKQKIANIKRGIRIGEFKTKESIKSTQARLASLIEKSGIEKKDQTKFLKTIKNIQTKEQFRKSLADIERRIEQYRQSSEKNRLESEIKKELKQTRPVKSGQKRVGKYDYESNKIFDELREYNTLSKAEAQTKLDAFPEESFSETDLIKKRLLALKASGKTASAELFNKVAEDIKRLKKLGKEAKDEADFIKQVNRQERVDDALQSIEKIATDKKTIKTKIGNVYRKGFSNIYSMLNSMFGKTFAEAYDPELSENTRDTTIYFKTKEMTEETARIYDNKDAVALLSRDMLRKEYTITDIDNLTTELSKLDLIDIYNSIKNDKIRERYNNAFGEAQVQSLIGELTAQDIEFADYLQETVQSYREIMNERNIEITGRDLGFVENYWPATSEHQISVLDDIRIQGETPSALKERAKSGKIIPIPKNAWLKAQKHIAEAEHVANLSREYETLKRLFGDRKLKHAINEKFGEDVYSVLMDQIENVSLHKQSAKIDAVSEWFGIAINNWVTSKIALNPSTYVRQLMSVGNYIENMSSLEWVKGFKEGISSPKETFDFMWKNAPFLEARFNKGYSEALARAMQGAEQLNVTWGNYTKFLSSLARYGDITAIIYGGYPVVKAELAKGKSMQEAIKTFERATLKAQQSGLGSSISQFQNSRNPFARLFLAFKNTSNQYFRKMVDAVISFQNGDISGSQFAKTMTIYAVIQPTLYAASGFLLKQAYKEIGQLARGIDRDDEILKGLALEIITQMAVSLVNAIPVIDDVAMFATRKLTGQKVYQVFSTPLFDELEKAGRKLAKEQVEAKDYLEATASILEPVTALPINVYLRIYKYLMEKKKSAF